MEGAGIRAELTWGFAEYVIIVLEHGNEGFQFIAMCQPRRTDVWKYGVFDKGHIGLTAKEAGKLAEQLMDSANKSEELDKGYMEASIK